MAYKDEPNWVSGRLGRLTLEPPITHPAFCPCSMCPKHREKRAARLGLPLAQVVAESIDIRVKRNSPHPRNRSLSKEAALRMKDAEEKRLNELVAGVQAAQVAKTNAVPFSRVVEHYRNYMIAHKKGYEHERYRIDKIEAFIGADRDVATIDYDLYLALLDEYKEMSAQTRRHYATTLLAMLKRAKAERVIKSHQLSDIILPPAPRNGDPQPWTRRELGIIMGPALLEYEADQAAWNAKVAEEKKNRGLRSPSAVPLRGYCLIGYYTMMRPDCNLHLRWDEVTLDAKNLTGWYKLDQHKNVNKGIKAEGPLAEEVVEYLLSIRPANPGNAPIHFNPETDLPYVDIRKQWERLMVIASRMLRYDLEDKKRTFFNFRHTGASHIAQRGKTPAHLLAVVQMMGDTSVATVNRHYFKMEPELMRELVLGWKRPDVDVPSVAAADLFGAEHSRICEIELPLAS